MEEEHYDGDGVFATSPTIFMAAILDPLFAMFRGTLFTLWMLAMFPLRLPGRPGFGVEKPSS